MDLPRLNQDVLLLILSTSDSLETQARLMQTCHFLYEKGARYLLGSVEMLCLADEELASFRLFMTVDSGSRMRFLNGLDIDCPGSKSAAESWVEFFRQLSSGGRLKHLEVSNSETLACRYPDLAQSIAQLESLTEIVLTEAGRRSWAMLKSTCSQLQLADIRWDHNLKLPKRLDLLGQLKASQATLESLSIQLDPYDHYAPYRMSVRSYCYPRMRDLSIPYLFPDASLLVPAFPNLKTLHIEITGHFPGPTEEEALRAANRASQLASNISWELEYYKGTFLELYILGLTGRIDFLELDDVYEHEEASYLRAVLADARPTRLHIDNSDRFAEHMGNEAWMSVLAEMRTPQIEVLGIRTKLLHYEDCRQSRMERVMENLCETIAALGLKAFWLELEHCRALRSEPTATALPSDAAQDPEAESSYFAAITLRELALRISRAAPSLRALCLKFLISGDRSSQQIVLFGNREDIETLLPRFYPCYDRVDHIQRADLGPSQALT